MILSLLFQLDQPRGGIAETSFGVAIAIAFLGIVSVLFRELKPFGRKKDSSGTEVSQESFQSLRGEVMALRSVVMEMQGTVSGLTYIVDGRLLPRLKEYSDRLRDVEERVP
jgi:hypothetical protein